MNFHNASFKAAYGTSAQLPESVRPEVSFAGRSNVGKVVAAQQADVPQGAGQGVFDARQDGHHQLLRRGRRRLRGLARLRLCKVSKSEKGRWSELIEGYFNQARVFALVVALVDIRHEAMPLDVHMIDFLRESGLPFAVVLTKADKLSNQQVMKQSAAIRKQLQLPKDVPFLATSAEKGTGIDDLRKLINEAVQAR